MNGATEATLAELLRVAQATNANISQLNTLMASAGSSSGGGGGIASVLRSATPLGAAFTAVGAVAGVVSGAFSVLGNIIGYTVGGFVTTGKNLIEFGKQMVAGTARMSDFYEALRTLPFGLGLVAGAFAEIAKYAEGLLDSYKTLTQAGASFGGDLMLMRQHAAEAGLSMAEFSKVIVQNSDLFASSAKGVDAGINTFISANRALMGPGSVYAKEILSLGLNAGEASDMLVSVMKSQGALGKAGAADSATLAKYTRDYVVELDTLSKLTGKRRDQLDAEVQAAESDELTKRFLDSLTPDQAQKAKMMIAQAEAFGGKEAGKQLLQQLRGLDAPIGAAQSALAGFSGGISVDGSAVRAAFNNVNVSGTAAAKIAQTQQFAIANALGKTITAIGEPALAAGVLGNDISQQYLQTSRMIKLGNGNYEAGIAETKRLQTLQNTSAAARMAETEQNLKNVGNQLSGKFLTLLAPVLDKMISWGTDFINWVTIGASQADGVVTLFSRMQNTMTKYVLPAMDDIVNWFTVTFKYLTDSNSADDFWKRLQFKAVQGWDNIWKAVQPIWDNNIKPALVDGFKDIVKFMEPIIVDLFKRVFELVSDSVNAFLWDKGLRGISQNPELLKQQRIMEHAGADFKSAVSNLEAAMARPGASPENIAALRAIADAANTTAQETAAAFRSASPQNRVSPFAAGSFRASGGPVSPGSYLVGEKGPEVLNVGASGDVINNDNLKQLLARVANEKPASSVLEELNNTMQQLLRYASATAENTGRTNGAIAGLSGNIMPVI